MPPPERGRLHSINAQVVSPEMQQKLTAFRQTTIDALQRGEMIGIERYKGQGDGLIRWWTYRQMLERFRDDHNIKAGRIRLVSYPRITTQQDVSNAPLQVFDIAYETDQIAKNFPSLTQINNTQYYDLYTREVAKLAFALGINEEVAERIRASAPRPYQMDYGMLMNYSEEVVINEGKKLLTENHNPKIVVVQGGSMAEKRFSDAQVSDLIAHIKAKSPHAQITVVSDRDVLKADVAAGKYPKDQPFSLFYPEIARDPGSLDIIPFKDARVLLGERDGINKIGAAFYAADTVVTTDTALAWYAGGVKAMRTDEAKVSGKDMVVLYTVSDPRKWRVPDASQVYPQEFQNLLPYYQPLMGSATAGNYAGRYNGQRGIAQVDINRTKEGIDFALAA